MAAVNRKIIAQATLMIMSSMFLSIGHMYGLLLLWKMKMKQTENNIMLYFLQKLNYLRSKKSLEKLEISIVKREAPGIFVVGMFFGEIYERPFTG